MSLSPLEIHKWAELTELPASWVWEMIEATTDSLSEVEDKEWLAEHSVEYVIACEIMPLIENVPIYRTLAAFYLHTLPLLAKLIPIMKQSERQRLHDMTRNNQYLTHPINALMSTR